MVLDDVVRAPVSGRQVDSAPLLRIAVPDKRLARTLREIGVPLHSSGWPRAPFFEADQTQAPRFLGGLNYRLVTKPNGDVYAERLEAPEQDPGRRHFAFRQVPAGIAGLTLGTTSLGTLLSACLGGPQQPTNSTRPGEGGSGAGWPTYFTAVVGYLSNRPPPHTLAGEPAPESIIISGYGITLEATTKPSRAELWTVDGKTRLASNVFGPGESVDDLARYDLEVPVPLHKFKLKFEYVPEKDSHGHTPPHLVKVFWGATPYFETTTRWFPAKAADSGPKSIKDWDGYGIDGIDGGNFHRGSILGNSPGTGVPTLFTGISGNTDVHYFGLTGPESFEIWNGGRSILLDKDPFDEKLPTTLKFVSEPRSAWLQARFMPRDLPRYT